MTTNAQSLSEQLRAFNSARWPLVDEAADALDAKDKEIERLRECVFRSNEKYIEVDDRLVDALEDLAAIRAKEHP